MGEIWPKVIESRSCTTLHQAQVSLPRIRFAFSFPSSPSDISKRFLHLLAHSCRKSPRLRHGIRKPRPSSVELSTDLKDVFEGEDVFYTYRASVSSSKDSEGDSSLHQLVSVATNRMCFSILLLWLFCLAPVVSTGRFYAPVITVNTNMYFRYGCPDATFSLLIQYLYFSLKYRSRLNNNLTIWYQYHTTNAK